MPTGTYAAVKYSDESVSKIVKFCDKYNIPKPLNPKKIHTTVLYSRKHCPDLLITTTDITDYKYTAEADMFDIWKSSPDDDDKTSNCLVLKLKSPQLVELHNVVMDSHKATYDFDKYNAHITLSYDVGDFQIKDIKSYIDEIGKLDIIQFYVEDLSLDWIQKS